MSKVYRAALIIIALVGLGAVLAYFSGAFHDKVSPATTDASLRVAGKAVPAVARTLPVYERVPGTVRAIDETLIASRILANILSISVRAGDRVEQGDLLVELDSEGLATVRQQREQQVAAARALLDDARLNRERTQSLRDKGSVSQAALDRAITDERRATAEFERAKQALAEAATALGYTRIVAPMSGTIVERYAEPGDTVVPGQTLLKLFDPGHLRVEATLRESLISFVSVGDTLVATIDANNSSRPVTVEEIVPTADPGSRTFLSKARLTDIEGLFPGMFARLVIPTGEAERIWIPARAVQQSGQLQFVYIRGPHGDTRRFVRLGVTDGELVEVRSGVDAGESVVVVN